MLQRFEFIKVCMGENSFEIIRKYMYILKKFAGTHLYTWVERGTIRVKYLAQEHNAVPRPGLEPGPPDPESSALTIRPPHLPQKIVTKARPKLTPLFESSNKVSTCPEKKTLH